MYEITLNRPKIYNLGVLTLFESCPKKVHNFSNPSIFPDNYILCLIYLVVPIVDIMVAPVNSIIINSKISKGHPD